MTMQAPAHLRKRIEGVAALFRPRPGGYEELFTKDFLAQVSPAQLTALFTSANSALGRCTGASVAALRSPFDGRFTLTFESGDSLPVDIAVSPVEPYLITGLLVGAPVGRAATLQDVVSGLAALPGKVSFLLARLDPSGLSTLAAHHPDTSLAVGSAYKLYVLCGLIQAVEDGEVRWSDVVELQESARSSPTGLLQQWPAGSPLTVHTLAALMIAQSDNTAADQLALLLGRENIERMLSAAGHSTPERNVPFLTSLEMFKLRSDPQGKAAAAYLSMDARSRRDFLDDVIAGVDREGIIFSGEGGPSYRDRIEWFATASDLCRAVDWIRRRTEGGPARAARDILAINRPLMGVGKNWRYVGYKGGSEPGVLNLTYLLQSQGGGWYALSASWNNTAEETDEGEFLSLVERALQLVP